MLVNCFCCEKQFNKDPNQIKRSKSGRHFCSRSCAAKINNLGKQKNKPVDRTCRTCSATYHTSNGHASIHFCQNCQGKVSDEYLNRTLGESVQRMMDKGLHKSYSFNEVRAFAKSWNKNLKEQACQCCGYSKHIEFCHIKAISSFDLDATLGEINSPDNIAILCRNCHWEFDHGELTIEQIPKRK